MKHRRLVSVTLLALSLGPLTSCAALAELGLLSNAMNPEPGARPTPPRLTSSALRLVESPTPQQLAAYYCAQLVQLPPGLPTPCIAFGPVPLRDQLHFTFALDATFRNENAIPLPVAEALVAFTAYPEASGQQNLGAVCISLCADGSACPQGAPGGCRMRQGDIRTMDDFGRAAVNFLFAVATGQSSVENLAIRTIPPNAEAQVTFRLGLDPETALTLMRTMGEQGMQELQRGQQPRFVLPYRFEGTVWVEVQSFGRFAAALPPVTGQWTLQ